METTAELRIRAALAPDAPAVRACVAEAFSPYIPRIGKPPGPMLLDHDAEIAAQHVWVLEAGGTIGGVLVQYETPHGHYVDTVAVAPRLQGCGAGKALLQFAEREAQRRGHASLYLCTNARMTENQRYYPRIGYVEVDRRHEAGYDRIYYRKPLA